MTNWLLSIDSSAGTTVAVLEGGVQRSEINIPDNMSHAESIASAIANALTTAGISASRVSTVAVGRGPAPFTGLRVGIASAMMFAEGAGARLFGVVSLDAIAKAALEDANLLHSLSETTPLLITADARRSEVYWALYSGLTKAGAPIRIDGPGVIKPAALEVLMQERGLSPIITSLPVSATKLGQVFEAQLIDGTADVDVTALYLRSPDAVPTPAKKVTG
jgi:tRNA threonylcarbamoyladenosine biosynthesis protein TsaB